jgi:hypothetical protein
MEKYAHNATYIMRENAHIYIIIYVMIYFDIVFILAKKITIMYSPSNYLDSVDNFKIK